MSEPGTLFVVATPIGNLEDLTFRALRTLQEVDLIAAEDTRRTSKLLAHYEISKPLCSLHEHNEFAEAPALVRELKAGKNIALVSDAGTPAISDPGALLVRQARGEGLRVVPIPGPSAVTAALSVSGLTSPRFSFLGFPPASGAARKQWFEQLAERREASVFFEAPHRIERTLREMLMYVAEKQIIVHKEISKIYETSIIWPSIDHVDSLLTVGEFVVVVGGRDEAAPSERGDVGSDASISMLGHMADLAGESTENVVAAIESARSMSQVRLKNALKKSRLAAKRRAGD
jgi:16S rRNA (cytidine1402-2'-O)-methyltransferase